jgi:hypothetical protein
MFSRVVVAVVAGCAFGAALDAGRVSAAAAQAPSSATASTAPADPAGSMPPRALLDKYCVGCHNQRLKTAGLMLDKIDVQSIPPGSETWEKVIRKIRGGSMPPAGRPRPPKDAAAGFVSWLESEIDAAAAAHPQLGRSTVHRLNRTEYQNAIRDLLAFDIDAAALLPGDDAALGFDNIADLLKVSPDLLDAYLAAANKISRLAVGDTALSLGSATYPVSKLRFQADQVSEDLPFGSRGGTAITHYFPYDGEFVFKVRVSGIAAPAQPVQIRIDGVKVAELPTTGRSGEDPADKGAVELRIPVKAGPRVVGVTFVNRLVESESRFPQYYPWGNSAVFATNTGGTNYLKVDSVDVAGPFKPQGPGDTPSRRRVFACHPANAAGQDACATKILTALARRAFRRPVTDADVQPLLATYKTARRDGDFDAAIQVALERLLVDPYFLFRVEQQPAKAVAGQPYRVSDLDLASRLSFFLWSSIPDDELLRVAESGKLSEPAVFEQQVKRMMIDPRSRALASNFAAQWLYLRNVKGATPDTFEFPDWDDDLRAALTTETELFIDSQMREDHGVGELLTANYTFVNERLAHHYGIPGIYGNRFRRVQLPDDRRAGLLGQASILMVTSQPNRTSPVMRGKWLLENLLGTPPPPPPPNVPDLAKNDPNAQPKSIRERMEQHRANPVCASCHAVMDPLGFSLENYDAIGAWRVKADGQPVDASGSLPDGTKFDGPNGLRHILENRREEFVTTFTEKLLTYALGRGVEYYDMPTIRKVVRGAAADDYRWSAIILGITRSPAFQMRTARSDS